MKVREDYVTNSSSSSFVISKKDVDYRKLRKILLELANEMYKARNDEEEDVYTADDFDVDGSIANLYVKNCRRNKPYVDEDGFTYDDHWYISNHDEVRYDWDVVEEVLDRNDVSFSRGYCD